ncbi:hypothetical protein [uncultured Sneathia sp.]|uniref:hypothetical protein n=1 Tax=uncultured Sneathia sp. TaxID=278067 RepID=UPI00259641C2|nr:hypothetical protein [uncultured Sneathia sp.]
MKKKNMGSSLIYILIMISILSIVSYGFFEYVHEKNRISKIDKYKIDKNILKKRLIKKEKRQVNILNNRGYLSYVRLKNIGSSYTDYGTNRGAYFNMCIGTREITEKILVSGSGENDEIEFEGNYIFFEDPKYEYKTRRVTDLDFLIYDIYKKSIGGYTVQKVETSSRRSLSLPLKREVDYGTIYAYYSKSVLDIPIKIREKISFSRRSGKLVPISQEIVYLDEVKND